MATNQGFQLEVAYFESDINGFMERHDFKVMASYDAPLKQSVTQIPPLAAEDVEIVCNGDNFTGERIDLNQKPICIEYIVNSLHSQKSPVLFVTRVKRDSGICMAPVERGMNLFRRPSISTEVLKRVLKKSESGSSSDSDSEHISIPQSEPVNSMSVSSEQQTGSASDSENQDVFVETINLTSVDLVPRRNPLKSDTLPNLQDMPLARGKTRKSSSIDSEAPMLGSATMRRHHNSEVIITSPTASSDATQIGFSPRNRGETFRERRRKAFILKRSSTIDLNVHKITVQITTESGYEVQIPCHSHITVGELKQTAGLELSAVGKVPGTGGIILTYSFDDKTYELVNDSQLLTNTLFLQKSDTTQEVLSGLRVCPLSAPVHKDLVIMYRITQLTRVLLDDRVAELGGSDICTFTTIAAPDKTEMEAARRTLHNYVTEVTSERETEDYTLSVDIARDAAPTTLILKVPYNNHIPVTFHYKKVFSLTKHISIHQAAESILKGIHHCLKECELITDSMDDYTMQMSGIDSYIHGNHKLIAFTDIRRCIIKNEPIHLSVLLKPSTLLYQPLEISWLHIDPYSYEPPHQIDVSEAYRRETRSLWEIPEQECFKLRLIRAENLVFDKKNFLTAEFSLHHGSDVIHGAVPSSSKVQDSFTMKWNEEISFITPLRDLPKAAKVLVVIRNSNSNSYHWGMINVFDHRSILRRGDHIIHMWEVKLESTKKPKSKNPTTSVPVVKQEEEAFSSILSGPAADNPNQSAIRVVLNLGACDKPIYYPSASRDSRKKLFKQHPSFRNVTLKKHFSKYSEWKFNLRTNKKPYHNLPVHLQCINWGSLRDRLEVYDVLDQIKDATEEGEKGRVVRNIKKVPLYIAFRLLDKDFPDEEVRAFATKVVECKVQADTLEDYLLQLTQALKFEHNHDSALARYLLKQALTNKRIGHMFFWYLRGEMQNPQYMLRFAVILEAYLKGCGEALLTKFMDHTLMQDCLETIGQKLKDTYGKDSARMQQALPKLLAEEELQKISLIPVINPRLCLGDLKPSRCRIMSSAKKPIYLEMVNISPTALQADPVRLIMKMGDDLRQDMMTLRMLSLFAKLWENEGLDLKLIPYGCMATGPRTGFIEVVKNSKTIAEVSGVRENKKLYEWIKRHQTDEFGEEDPEKLKAAIDTFVHSCAGYSVATYILGIGDRHNDNIMITTSGNLFHIDFGHFLGNIKHFMTFKREWAPFVLTPDFTYVMGGEDSDTFQFYKHLCIRAFLILRRHADLIINLFSMMRSTGIPELTCVEDTDYIRTALATQKSDTEAERLFQTVIQKCLDLKWTVQIMWGLHKLRVTSPPSAKNK